MRDCADPTIPVDRWVQELRRQSGRFPLSASIELTERCNLRCVHCYINRPAGDRDAASQELDLERWTRILDQLADAGTLWLLYTGGEPLLRPDFAELFLAAKRRGFLVTLFTNGTLLNEDLVHLWQEYPPRRVEITLYGATETTYERVTGVPGSFARCLRGIELLHRYGIPLELKSVLMRQNVHEFGEMRRLALEYGRNFRFDALLNPRLDGDARNTFGQLSIEEVVTLDQSDPQRWADWKRLAEQATGPGLLPYRYNCGAGLTTCHIDAYGRLSPCLLARHRQYDLRVGDFRTGWEEFLGSIRSERRRRATPCDTCRFYNLCGVCPGWSHLAMGDEEEPIPFLCRVGRERAARLGIGGEQHVAASTVGQQTPQWMEEALHGKPSRTAGEKAL
ncbi:MAG: radical SAM protein [Chloroflexia bacterium]